MTKCTAEAKNQTSSKSSCTKFNEMHPVKHPFLLMDENAVQHFTLSPVRMKFGVCCYHMCSPGSNINVGGNQNVVAFQIPFEFASTTEVAGSEISNSYGGGGGGDDQWHYSPDWLKPPLIQFHTLS
jgi:hypothetical protein